MRDAFVASLEALASENDRIMLLTGDLGFGVLDRFAQRFPAQFLNVGVAEQNMTGVATGLALLNRVVFTYSIGNFPTLRCLEQIRNDAAYHGANVNVVSIGGGFSYGALGMSHHATEDLAIIRALGIPVIAPGCDWEAAGATVAIANATGTCYLRLDRSTAGNTGRPGEAFVMGRARELRSGTDATVIVAGGLLGEALAAAEHVATDHNLRCRVLSMHTVHPIDKDAIAAAARETGGIVTAEEHTIHGGLGSAVAEVCLDDGLRPKSFERVGLRAGFSAVVGSQDYLRRFYGVDRGAIAQALVRVARGGSL